MRDSFDGEVAYMEDAAISVAGEGYSHGDIPPVYLETIFTGHAVPHFGDCVVTHPPNGVLHIFCT